MKGDSVQLCKPFQKLWIVVFSYQHGQNAPQPAPLWVFYGKGDVVNIAQMHDFNGPFVQLVGCGDLGEVGA